MTTLSHRLRRNRIAVAATVAVGYSAVMIRFDRQMIAAGGPGIIAFELAGTAAAADHIMTRWGEDGRRAARRSMWFDFGYMTSYGILLGLLIDRRRRRRGHSVWLPTAAAVAVAGDAVEGVALLHVLGHRDVAHNARTARRAAVVKFALIAASLAYVLAPDSRITSGSTRRP